MGRPLEADWKIIIRHVLAPVTVFSGSIGMAVGQQTLSGAIQTESGRFLTAVNGGGLGGPNDGPGATALHSDATSVGPWETFGILWTDPARCEFAVKTSNGTFLSAVNGGGVGGPNTSTSPFHTDAQTIGEWERFDLVLLPDHIHAYIQTPDRRHLVTAVNGGGFGGPNEVPIHTDAVRVGQWERFVFVPSVPNKCDSLAAPALPASGPSASGPLPQNQYSRTVDPGVVLMRSGLWATSATGNMAGQAMTNNGQQCITAEKVQEIVSGNAQALLQMPSGGGCQLQQNMQGRQLVGNGECTMGGMALQISIQITFDTPSSFSGQMSEGVSGQPGRAVNVRVEGRRIGDCGS